MTFTKINQILREREVDGSVKLNYNQTTQQYLRELFTFLLLKNEDRERQKYIFLILNRTTYKNLREFLRINKRREKNEMCFTYTYRGNKMESTETDWG